MSGTSRFRIHKLSLEDIPEIMALQLEHQRLHPQAEVIDGVTYLSPGFDGGENVICAVDDNGKLVGYVPVYAHLVHEAGVPHLIWANMVVSPDIVNPEPLRDLLFEHAVRRAREVTTAMPDHSIRMMFQYHVSEVESIKYVVSKGAVYSDSVLRMVRDLSKELVIIPAPDNIEVRYWRMETEAEQKAYVEARNEAFPHMPVTVAEWRYFLFSVVGDTGTTVAAFEADEVVGAVSAYWYESENRLRGRAARWTENIFVRPPWRGRGIADCMISMALVYLKEHDLKEAQLDPGASNQRAVRVYERLGYVITDESQQFVLVLS